MTRSARMVTSGLLHHVTQRGNRREVISSENRDQEVYRDLLAEQARKAAIEGVGGRRILRDNSLLRACCRPTDRLS
jgi:hypothetical protein